MAKPPWEIIMKTKTLGLMGFFIAGIFLASSAGAQGFGVSFDGLSSRSSGNFMSYMRTSCVVHNNVKRQSSVAGSKKRKAGAASVAATAPSAASCSPNQGQSCRTSGYCFTSGMCNGKLGYCYTFGMCSGTYDCYGHCAQY